MYNLIVLGWIFRAPPSHATHSSREDWDGGNIEPSEFLNWGYSKMKSIKDFCPVL